MIPRIHNGTRRTRGGSGGTWTPADLSDIIVFCSADTSDNFTFASGTNISQWDDLGGGDLHYTASSNYPNYNSTNKCVEFNNGNYLTSTDVQYLEEGKTLFIGIRRCTDSDGAIVGMDTSAADWQIKTDYITRESYNVYGLMVSRNGTGGDGTCPLFRNGSSMSYSGGYFSTFCFGWQWGIDANNKQFTMGDDWGDVDPTSTDDVENAMRLNGSDDSSNWVYGSTNSGTVENRSQAWMLGNSDSENNQPDVEMEFYLVVDGIMSESDAEKVEGWWAHTFSHTDLLPAGHTYKSSAP